MNLEAQQIVDHRKHMPNNYHHILRQFILNQQFVKGSESASFKVFKRQLVRVIGKKGLMILVRHTKNDESETSTTWSTSTGFGGTSNR